MSHPTQGAQSTLTSMSARLLNTTTTALVYNTQGNTVDAGAAVNTDPNDPIAKPLLTTGRLVDITPPTPPRKRGTDAEKENA